MKKSLLFLFILFFTFSIATAQTPAKYTQLVREAKVSMDKKEYKKSALLYSEAFKVNSGKAFYQDRYNAACSNAMAGYTDSAFFQLFKVAELYNFSDYDSLTRDSHFSSLRADKRWNEVLSKVKQNIGRTETKMNRHLVMLLDSVYRNDQLSRLKAVSIKNQYGTEAKETKEEWKAIQKKDSVNLMIVLDILDKYGWVGKNVVGAMGNSTLSLVMHRADSKIQVKYLPMMREAFKNNNVDVYDLAVMEDMVALKERKKQIYGSQLKQIDEKKYCVLPIEEPETVNERRTKIGLNTMNEFLKKWNMPWDMNNYKKDLLILEERKIQY